MRICEDVFPTSIFVFREFPPVLDYFSYMFHFQTVFAGPLSFYTDYLKFIDGENFGADLGVSMFRMPLAQA